MNILSSGSKFRGFEVVKGPMEDRSLRGGMGVVYICLDHESDELPVAVKTIHPEFLSDANMRTRFLQECQLWIELGAHPNIVRCYRIDADPITLGVYLVLELIEPASGKQNASLRAWLSEGKAVSQDKAVDFALGIARAMKYATDKIPGLIHRDLKPENILIDYNSAAHVTDFGLAKTLSVREIMLSDPANDISERVPQWEHSQMTRGVVGTPLYMPPEQWAGKPLDLRTDIYAFGCILYELLTGKHFIEAHTLKGIESQHMEGCSPTQIEALPKYFQSLVSGCLALNVDERYGSWAEVVTIISDVYEQVIGSPVHTELLSSVQQTNTNESFVRSYFAICRSYEILGKLDLSLQAAHRALNQARSQNNSFLEGRALKELARLYMATGDASQAEKYLRASLLILETPVTDKLYKESDRQFELGQLYGTMGQTYRKLGDIQKALAYSEKAVQIFVELNHRGSLALELNFQGHTYRVAGDLEKAIECYQRSLILAISSEFSMLIGNNCFALAQVLYQLGRSEEALPLAQRAQEVYSRIGRVDWADDARGLAKTIQIGPSIRNELDDTLHLFLSIMSTRDLIQKFAIQRPIMRTQRFLGTVEGIIQHYEQQHQNMIADQLRMRLGWLKEIAKELPPVEELSESRQVDRELLNAAFVELQRSQSPAETEKLLDKYPIMQESIFFEVVFFAIEDIPPAEKRAIMERLASLKTIVEQRQKNVGR